VKAAWALSIKPTIAGYGAMSPSNVLKVKSRTTMMQYKGTKKTPREVGEELQASENSTPCRKPGENFRKADRLGSGGIPSPSGLLFKLNREDAPTLAR